ncbi:MAG: TIGR03118 family protein [Cyanothece sp. SIO2G6]|nr:TIGR03118 family protein [Cyanothece sp. SIO2G6]
MSTESLNLIELESNDTFDTATLVSITTALPGAIATGSLNFDFVNNRDVDATEDVDLYAFELAAGDTIKLDLDAAGSTMPVALAELILFDSAGNNLATGSFVDPGPNDAFTSFLPYIEYTATEAGIYYAGVSAYFNLAYDPFTAGSGSGVTFEEFGFNGFGDYALGFELVNDATPVSTPNNPTPDNPVSDAPPQVSLRTVTGTYALDESLIAPAVVETVNDLGLAPFDGLGGAAITLILSTEGNIGSGVEVVVDTGIDLTDYLFTFEPFIRGGQILGPVLDDDGNPTGFLLNLTAPNTLLNLTLFDKPEPETDGPEQITFTLQENPGITVNPDAAASTITVYDTVADVPPTVSDLEVSLAISESALIETARNATTLTFTLSEPPPAGGIIVYANTEPTVPDGAVEGTPFQGLGQFDIFNADITGGPFPSPNFTASGFYFNITEQTATITVSAFPDAIEEGIQEFRIFLEESAGYQLDPDNSSVVLTTADTATSLPQLALSVEPTTLIETEETVSVHTFNLSTTPPPEGIEVSVLATGLEDFDLTSLETTGIMGDIAVVESDPPQLVFTMTEATATISLSVADDGVSEGVETATFTLNPSEAYQISPLAESGSFQIADTPAEVPPSPVEVESNDTLDSAIAVDPTPDNPVVISGDAEFFFDFFSAAPIIDIAEDVDMYSFDLAAGESIEIDVDAIAPDGSESLLQPVLRVFDASGSELDSVGQVETLDAVIPGAGEASLTFTPETAGTYYVGISVLGNDAYDPTILGSGSGWTVEDVAEPGAYQATFSTPSDAPNDYVVTNLVSNNPDNNPQLLDPYASLGWGIAIRPAGAGGHFWISNSGTGVSSEYIGDVGGVPIYQDDLKVVEVTPSPFNPLNLSGPTGQVFNGSEDFVITQDHPNGEITAPSKFIFVTTDGTISAWNERQNEDGSFDRSPVSEIVVDKFGDSIYYGVAITDFEADNRLYVADFGFTPDIEVYDANFNEITADFDFPNPFAAEGFAEYNIQLIEDSLFVAYAFPLPGVPGDEVVQAGLGRIAEFDLDGNLIATWDDGGFLNAPWGFVVAPDDFGQFSNNLLVSNFDGTIVAFDRETRAPIDYLRDGTGEPIFIDGLWGLTFGNGESLGESNDLYFAAGNDVGDDFGDDPGGGVFGKIEVAADVDPIPVGGDETIIGTPEDDLLNIGGDNNTIATDTGNDVVTAFGDNQTIDVGDGNNIVSIGSGNVTAGDGNNFIAASNGSTTVNTGAGNDTINLVKGNLIANAGEGDNHFTSGAGDDQIMAGSGDDIVHAGAGNNTIDVGDGDNQINSVVAEGIFLLSVGNNTITTGDGADTFQLAPGEGIATITNFDSSDRFDLRGYRLDFFGALDFSDLTIAQDGADTVITLTRTEDVLAVLQNVQADTIDASTFGESFDESSGYVVTNLVANEASYNPQMLDPYLSLGWGIAIRPAGLGGHFWLSASGTGTSAEYVGDVGGVPIYQDDLKLVDVTPTEFNPFGISGPTGQVFNGSGDFVITQDHPNGDITAPSKFIFVATDGGISAWTERANDDGTIDRPLVSEVVVDKFLDSIYYGVAITNFESDNRLYVADFGIAPEIEVYDANFNEITADFEFANPFEAEGYAEYNIQLIEDSLLVAYAAPNPEVPGDEIVGEGLGGIAEFDLDGNLIATWDGGDLLDAPWGFVMAPDNFGEYSNMLLVSNFGDGTIVAFDPETRTAVDYLRDDSGEAIVIDGLWGLTFGNGGSLGETNDLYFAAGNDLGDGAGDGVFGKVEVIADVDVPDPGGNQIFEGTAADDLYVVSGDNNTFLLGEGNDTVTARGLNQTILAGDGDDILSIGSGVVDLGEGTNFVAASDGSMIVTAGSGNDTVNLVQGNLVATVGDGDNHVTSGAGDDTIIAGSGDDIVHAGDGTNTIIVGEGDNTINSIVNDNNFLLSIGNNTIYTGSGVDTFILGPGTGVATIANFDGSDRFELVGFNLDFSGTIGFSDVAITQDGDDTVISLAGTEDVIAILQNIDASTVTAENFGANAPIISPTPTSIDFDTDSLAAGDVVSDQIAGVTISVAEDLDAMIFDSANPTGGDKDLASSDLGNILIISEDGDSSDPDDNATGGTLMFDWDGVVNVESLGLLDIDEPGSMVILYGSDDTTVLKTIAIPALDNNSYQSLDIGTTDVGKMDVVLDGSGAVADIILSNSEAVI